MVFSYYRNHIKACFNIYFFNSWWRLFLLVETVWEIAGTTMFWSCDWKTLMMVMWFWDYFSSVDRAKTARYDRIINELCHFYKVSLIKTWLMFHKYHCWDYFSSVDRDVVSLAGTTTLDIKHRHLFHSKNISPLRQRSFYKIFVKFWNSEKMYLKLF
jgi:hypothetical protein